MKYFTPESFLTVYQIEHGIRVLALADVQLIEMDHESHSVANFFEHAVHSSRNQPIILLFLHTQITMLKIKYSATVRCGGMSAVAG